jgi:Na+/melibiose symporter-like transporter
MCLCEAVSAWATMVQLIGPKNLICYLGLGTMLEGTVWWISQQAIAVLVRYNIYIMKVSAFMSLSLNFCYFNEILQLLSAPFESPRYRLTTYYAFTLLFAFIAPFYTLAFNEKKQKDIGTNATFGVIIIMLFVLFAVKSLVGVRRITLRAYKAAIKNHEKKLIITCYNNTFFLYIMFYTTCWLIFAIINYYVLFLTFGLHKQFEFSKESLEANINPKDSKNLIWFCDAHLYCMLFMGIIMSILRAIITPEIWWQIKRLAAQFYGEKIDA